MARNNIKAGSVYLWTEGMGRFSLELPGRAVLDIAKPGRADDAVARWRDRVTFRGATSADLRADFVRATLSEYGAWDEEELRDDAENWERIVWIAACDIKEETEPCEVTT